MSTPTARVFLGLASLLSAVGGAFHALAFQKALTAINTSDLPRFYGNSAKGLWLADSATLFILAVLFGVLAVRPSIGTRSALILVALIPAATAIMIYAFVGPFFAGHMLLAIATLVILASVQSGKRNPGELIPSGK